MCTLSDNEIVKALECCIEIVGGKCYECPYKDIHGCEGKLIKNTFDLITRQRAEIERLKKEVANQTAEKIIFQDTVYDLKAKLKTAKAEAVNEFAKRLKAKAYTYSDITGYQSTVVDVCEIDGVKEEMVGENDVS